MKQKFCLKCATFLTSKTASIRYTKLGGYCRQCDSKRNSEYHRRHPEVARRRAKKHRTTFIGRHKQLKKKLKLENVSDIDPAWSVNFYSSLVLEDSCHYCGGGLSKSGHSLDRIDNSLGHQAFNLVPCCGRCNSVKSNYFTYKDMLLLAPTLRKIREARGT